MTSFGPPNPRVHLAYGTAGFRAKAELLDSTFFRMGALAVLRSRSRQGMTIGLMVTASHNPVQDNGIKLIDADGGMLDQTWEVHATALANAPDGEAERAFESIAASVGVSAASDGGGSVYVARDTRPHSASLSALALEGIRRVGGVAEDFNTLTTPQLHHIVRHRNGVQGSGPHVGPAEWASEEGYYHMLCDAYSALVPPAAASPDARGGLCVDAACGIGAPRIQPLVSRLAPLLRMTVVNGVDEGELNAGCGAEFVQKGRLPPRGLDTPPEPAASSRRACSVDGDADRVVFHYWRGGRGKEGPGGKEAPGGAAAAEWRLLDGDKIAALYAAFVCDELSILKLSPALSMACVQTAYANGASGAYVRSLGVPTKIAKTGVKYVHHVAVQYDIAVYFEANGHGTLLFSDQAVEALLSAKADAEAAADAAKASAASRLLAARQLVNQAIGDALSDLLLVEAILSLRGWTIEDWDHLYEDLPSRQSKLAVADRTVVKVTADETRTIEPADLQPALDALAASYPDGRCFVRPSGTEVRGAGASEQARPSTRAWPQAWLCVVAPRQSPLLNPSSPRDRPPPCSGLFSAYRMWCASTPKRARRRTPTSWRKKWNGRRGS